MTITQVRLKQVLDYNPLTGIFTWKTTNNQVKAGDKAGCVHKANGYIDIMVDGKKHKAHRLAWFYIHGTWPKVVDHVDGCKTDNRIAYLKDTTVRGNNSNTYRHRAGYMVGTSFCKHRQMWTARISINGKDKFLGRHLTQELASQAYQNALANLN